MSHDVFVSYARADADLVESAVHRLEGHMNTVWIDRRDIPVSVPWLEEVREAIDASRLVVIFDTEAWRRSEACQLEEQWADERGKQTVVVDPIGVPSDRIVDTVNATLARQPPILAAHVDLLVRADEWAQNSRSPRYLARGRRLRRSFAKVVRTPGLVITPDMKAFIRTSRRRARRRRITITAATLGVLLTIVLLTSLKDVATSNNRGGQEAIAVALAGSRTDRLVEVDLGRALTETLAAYRAAPGTTLRIEQLARVLSVPVPTTVTPLPTRRAAGLLPAAGGVWFVAEDGRRFRIHDAREGRSSSFVRGRTIAGSSDGSVAAAADPGGVSLWDHGNTSRVAVAGVAALAVAPDGSAIAFGGPGSTVRWRRRGGLRWAQLRLGGAAISSLAVPRGTEQTIYVGRVDGSLVRIDTRTRQTRVVVSPDDLPSSTTLVAIDPGSRYLAAARGSHMTLLSLPAAELLQNAHASGDVRALAFDPDGRFLAAADSADAVELWDLSTGIAREPLRTYDGAVGSLAWSEGGDSLWATTANNRVLGWRFPGRRLVDTDRRKFVAIASARAGRALFAVDDSGAVAQVDPARGRVVRQWRTHSAKTYRAAASPNGTAIALLQLGSPTARVLDPRTGAVRTLRIQGCPIVAIAYAPAPLTQLAAACSGGRVVVASRSGDVLRSTDLTGQELTSIAFGNAEIVVGSYWGSTYVLTPALKELSHVTRAPVLVVAIDDADRRYASIGEGGDRVLASLLMTKAAGPPGAIYNIRSSDSHATRARALAFSHDGSRLAVGFADGEVDIIDLHHGTTARSFPFAVPGAVMGLAFSSDSKSLLVAGSSGVIDVLPGSLEYVRGGLASLAAGTLAKLRNGGLLSRPR